MQIDLIEIEFKDQAFQAPTSFDGIVRVLELAFSSGVEVYKYYI